MRTKKPTGNALAFTLFLFASLVLLFTCDNGNKSGGSGDGDTGFVGTWVGQGAQSHMKCVVKSNTWTASSHGTDFAKGTWISSGNNGVFTLTEGYFDGGWKSWASLTTEQKNYVSPTGEQVVSATLSGNTVLTVLGMTFTKE